MDAKTPTGMRGILWEDELMRIISGSARGRKILALEGSATRPTADRVRESIFAIIQFDVPGAAVLDLFSGSGAMAVEALSRGANSAVLCDADRRAADVCRRNLAALSFEDRATVRVGDYKNCLTALRGLAFDLIFLDPPYGLGMEQEALRLIEGGGFLNSGGKAVVEHPAGMELASIYRKDCRRYGNTGVTIITKDE